jgi:hypothetical protein
MTPRLVGGAPPPRTDANAPKNGALSGFLRLLARRGEERDVI